MRILVIGSGGREHAIAWKLAAEGHEVLGAPGNPGIARVGAVLNTTDYLAAAISAGVDLTVVGPEAPLVAGIVDQFEAGGYPIVGPNQAQAQLEGSKIHAKKFMVEAGIPTARAVEVDHRTAALDALRDFAFPVVIKADGLAGGKGVIIANDRAEAVWAIGTLGERLIIEEYLTGEEVSFIALCDGHNVLPLEATQDHKAVLDGDRGPNTGGMGAYCDGRILAAHDVQFVMNTVIHPVVERTGFHGFLYAGLMMTTDGPRVLEFNARLGDPETQALVHRMDVDFGAVLYAAATGRLNEVQLGWRAEPSVCVVLAAHGYPDKPRTGDLITGIDDSPAEVFQAGTRQSPRGLETAGGRVLGVTARGGDLAKAIEACYAGTHAIHFEGMHYRSDIGRKGLKRW